MKLLGWLILVLPVFNSVAYAATERFPIPDSRTSLEQLQDRHWWFRMDGASGVQNQKFLGGGISAGYQWGILGADLRFTAATLNYGAISVLPSYADNYSTSFAPAGANSFPGSLTSGSEYERARSASDPWTLFCFEPGISATGRAFTDRVPLLSETGRLGLGVGYLNDQQNSVLFSTLLFTIEGGLQYQLSRDSPFELELAGDWDWGKAQSTQLSGEAGRLPISFVTVRMGLLYWF